MSGKDRAAIFPIESVHALFVGQPHGDHFVARPVASTTSPDLFASSRCGLPIVPELYGEFGLRLFDDEKGSQFGRKVSRGFASKIPVINRLPLPVFLE